MTRDKTFLILLAVAAILIAAVAACFSIFGISKMFASYAIAVIVMAGSLEAAKLIAVSYVQRYWQQIHWLSRTYLLVGIISLMVITSAGIYGFLSNAYQETATKLNRIEQTTNLISTKQSAYEIKIKSLTDRLDSKTVRTNMLSDLRSSQERRLDSLYLMNTWNTRQSTATIEANISQANVDILKLDTDISELQNSIGLYRDSIIQLDLQKIEVQNNSVSADLGPLKYLARITGKSMDTVINWFILLLICVFDPFAVALLIEMNRLATHRKSNSAPPNENIPTDEPVKPTILSNEHIFDEPVIDTKSTSEVADESEHVPSDVPTQLKQWADSTKTYKMQADGGMSS